MIRIVKNGDRLELKNVICFYVGKECPASYEKLPSKKEDWTYQDWLTDACHNMKLKLIWLNKHYAFSKFDGSTINIDDCLSNEHFSLDKDNAHDTVIFQGQANGNVSANYECLMKAFEYMGFFMMNTFDEIRLASDKMLSANILSSAEIPQPNYCIMSKNIMQDNEGNTRDIFWKTIDSLYVNNANIEDEQERKFVVKTLDGSLGIGVFICNRNEIEAILQTIFLLNENIELTIQEFKKNTGDIRIHVFSIDGKRYEILAAMKRNKIDKDFRSNVSLGATTENINLTDKQKEIALSVAQISKCRWVGVDLMECEDGSNVVIEYNSSPGVQGISLNIKKNIFEIILNKIVDYFKNTEKNETTTEEYIKNVHPYVEYDKVQIEKCKTEWETLSEKRNKVLNECLTYTPGSYYRMHGKKDAASGLDCSGYVKRVFKDSIDADLPNMCVEYFIFKEANSWEPVSKNDLKPGDIGIKHDTTKDNHMGIYAGDGKWFETSSIYGVQLTDYPKFKYFFKVKDIDEK